MTTLSENPLSPEIQDGIHQIHASLDQAETDLATVTDEQTPEEEKTTILQQYSDLMQRTRIGWQNVPEETIDMLTSSALMDHPDWKDAWQRDEVVSRKWLELFQTGLNADVQGYQTWVRHRLSPLDRLDEMRAEEA